MSQMTRVEEPTEKASSAIAVVVAGDQTAIALVEKPKDSRNEDAGALSLKKKTVTTGKQIK